MMTPTPTAIVGSQYCAPYPLDLALVKKVGTFSHGNFAVTDVNGNIVLKVKGSILTHDYRVFFDAAGNPILTLRKKLVTMSDRWEAFRGESIHAKDLIFTLTRSSLFPCKTKLDVFLASNTKENVCDFKVKGSWFERSCIVYAGESNNIVAQMHPKFTLTNALIGKDHYMVRVYPNVDYAFIIALIVILDEMNRFELHFSILPCVLLSN
ncbi:protein LURP-one-related 15-like [Cicer arietinum]|uniref:Protein LURP-one-related 15-like n=1 Tax=Cicer arietinum TaxID=3827 RepID=A0A1S3E007_CICAR|nr:protein LURP-one-related 15-like [Cicer arietinum]